MQVDPEQCWGAIEALAIDDNVASIPREVIDKLIIAYGLAERVDGRPRLTTSGERAYVDV